MGRWGWDGESVQGGCSVAVASWRQEGGSSQWNWWFHIHVWWVKIRGTPCEQANTAPGQTAQPRVPVLGKK